MSGRRAGFLHNDEIRAKVEFYVYRIFDGHETVYVGKGSGKRLADQKRKFGLSGEIIEDCRSDDHAFERERYWIKTLVPSENISPGGNGGRCKPHPKPRRTKGERDYDRIGPRRYAAQFLIRKLDETNIARYGISKLELDGLRAVANGPWR